MGIQQTLQINALLEELFSTAEVWRLPFFLKEIKPVIFMSNYLLTEYAK